MNERASEKGQGKEQTSGATTGTQTAPSQQISKARRVASPSNAHRVNARGAMRPRSTKHKSVRSRARAGAKFKRACSGTDLHDNTTASFCRLIRFEASSFCVYVYAHAFHSPPVRRGGGGLLRSIRRAYSSVPFGPAHRGDAKGQKTRVLLLGPLWGAAETLVRWSLSCGPTPFIYTYKGRP